MSKNSNAQLCSHKASPGADDATLRVYSETLPGRVGEEIALRLPVDPASGQRWHFLFDADAIAQLPAEIVHYHNSSIRLDGPFTEEYRFSIIRPGRTVLDVVAVDADGRPVATSERQSYVIDVAPPRAVKPGRRKSGTSRSPQSVP